MSGISLLHMHEAMQTLRVEQKRLNQVVYCQGIPVFPGRVMEFENGHGNPGKVIYILNCSWKTVKKCFLF